MVDSNEVFSFDSLIQESVGNLALDFKLGGCVTR